MEISKNQDKNWRKQQEWYINGKKNECEIYQKKLIVGITGSNLEHTNDRIDMELCCIKEEAHPNKNENGFEITENFDGKQTFGEIILYFNLKFVCDSGGSQTRTLRETYLFIKTQILITSQNVYFVNILDGDGSYKFKKQFDYLLSKSRNDKIFIGDTSEFQKWWKSKTFSKKSLGQFYTTNSKYILSGMKIQSEEIVCEPLLVLENWLNLQKKHLTFQILNYMTSNLNIILLM